MADKLVVVEDRQAGFRIQWQLDDDMFDTGGFLGQSKREPSNKVPKDQDSREYWAYEKAGFQIIKEGDQDTRGHDSTGFWWESHLEARTALTRIKAVATALMDVSWPEWAKTALAAGWKPPKGWKP